MQSKVFCHSSHDKLRDSFEWLPILDFPDVTPGCFLIKALPVRYYQIAGATGYLNLKATRHRCGEGLKSYAKAFFNSP
jgi:hypothetical protein